MADGNESKVLWVLDRLSAMYSSESTSGIFRSLLNHSSAPLYCGYAGQVAQDSLPCHYYARHGVKCVSKMPSHSANGDMPVPLCNAGLRGGRSHQ